MYAAPKGTGANVVADNPSLRYRSGTGYLQRAATAFVAYGASAPFRLPFKSAASALCLLCSYSLKKKQLLLSRGAWWAG